MGKTWLIIKREYITRVRKLSFIVMTILMPVLLIGLMAIVAYLSVHSGEGKKVVVMDQSGYFENKLSSGSSIQFSYSNLNPEILKKEINDGKYDAGLFVPSFKIEAPTSLEIYSKDQLSLTTQQNISEELNKVLTDQRIKNAQIDSTLLRQLQASTITLKNTTFKGEENSAIASFIVAYGAGFLLYFFMIAYGMGVMRSVMEEKTNRIAEIIVSSVRPYQLMLGKILGVALVGLTQFLIWVILLVGIGGIAVTIMGISVLHGGLSTEMISQAAPQANPELLNGIQGLLFNINWTSILLWFIFYFLGGYFLYAALYAAVGSLVDDEQQDAQQFTLPITIPIIIAFVLMTSALNDPNGGLALFGSLFPLTSPIVMMARIPFGVPGWQLILSAVILVASFLLTTGLAAKIYRTGILLYGKKITFKEVMKWVVRKG